MFIITVQAVVVVGGDPNAKLFGDTIENQKRIERVAYIYDNKQLDSFVVRC